MRATLPERQQFTSAIAARRLGQLALISWLVLAVTGVYLFFRYRPTATAAYSDMETLRGQVTVATWARRAHNIVSIPALVIPVALAGIHFDRSHLRPALVASAGVLTTAGLWFSGKLLPWDQLALWAVTSGTDMWAYTPIFGDDDVRFVLINGTEVSTGTL